MSAGVSARARAWSPQRAGKVSPRDAKVEPRLSEGVAM